MQLGDLLNVGEQVAAGQWPGVDDHALEDVELHIRLNAIDHPDALAIAVVDRGALLEADVGDRRAELVHGSRLPHTAGIILPVLLAELVEASDAVGATRSRLEKVERIAAVLERLSPDEVGAGVAFLSGELRQRQIGVGWAALRDLPAAADAPSLTVGEVDAAFERIGGLAGPGSQVARRMRLSSCSAARRRGRPSSCGGCWVASCDRGRSRG